MGKKNVAVTAKFSEDGKVTPISIQWEDGRTFEIDRITDVRKAASLKAGGMGVRYTCHIRGKEVYMFKDENNWFLETKD